MVNNIKRPAHGPRHGKSAADDFEAKLRKSENKVGSSKAVGKKPVKHLAPKHVKKVPPKVVSSKKHLKKDAIKAKGPLALALEKKLREKKANLKAKKDAEKKGPVLKKKDPDKKQRPKIAPIAALGKKPLDKKPKELKKSRFSAKQKKLLILIFVFSFVLLVLIMAYLIYRDLPGSPQSLNIVIRDPYTVDIPNLNNIKQFYPNMKFNHNDISYNIEDSCDDDKTSNIIGAFERIKDKVGVLTFYEVPIDGDIEIICSDDNKHRPIGGSDFFIAGEGGARQIIQTGRYNIITNGTVLLYGNPQEAVECSWPNVEMHEILHVLGFNHSTNENSLMYPYLNSCNQKFDEVIVNALRRLYLEENLPDVYFDSIEAVKRGRYLDFNITVKNSGSKDAENVKFSVLDNGRLIKTNEMDNIQFGAGVKVEVRDFRLKSRNPDEIRFVIDYAGEIEEIDKANNIVKVEFD